MVGLPVDELGRDRALDPRIKTLSGHGPPDRSEQASELALPDRARRISSHCCQRGSAPPERTEVLPGGVGVPPLEVQVRQRLPVLGTQRCDLAGALVRPGSQIREVLPHLLDLLGRRQPTRLRRRHV